MLETLENTGFVDDTLTQKKLKNGVTNRATNRNYVLVSPWYTFKVLDGIKKVELLNHFWLLHLLVTGK